MGINANEDMYMVQGCAGKGDRFKKRVSRKHCIMSMTNTILGIRKGTFTISFG